MIHAIQYADQRLDCLLQLSDAVAHAVDAPAQPRKDGGWQKFHDQLVQDIAATKVDFSLSYLSISKKSMSQNSCSEQSMFIKPGLVTARLRQGQQSKVVLSLHITPLTIQMNLIQ